MAVNLEQTTGAGTSPLQADRRNAGARQDRWMLELEKAFTTNADVRNPHGAPSAPAASDRSARPPAAAAAAPAPVAAGAHASRPAAVTPAGALHASRAGAVHATPASVRRAESDAMCSDETEGRVANAASDTSEAAGSPAAAPALFVYAAGVSAAGGMPEGGGVQAPRANAGLAPQVFLPAMPTTGAAPQRAQAFAAQDLPEAASGGAGRPAKGTPFEQRALHVFVDGQRVHAYIRDAALQATQLHSVMQAMSAEFAASGQQLATLTVNGKPVGAGAASMPDDDESLIPQHPRGEHASAIRYPSQPAFKGNP